MRSSDFVIDAPPRPSLTVRGQHQRFPVRRIYCIGRNYLAHIREMGEANERDPPIFFQKPDDSLAEAGRPLPYTAETADYQYEAERVVAIGAAAPEDAPVPVEQTNALIYGYAVGLDMTRRDLQRAAAKAGQPWENGKSSDHSAPGSEVVLVIECGHPTRGALRLTVNGQPRQHTDLSQLIWGVPEIIANQSRYYRLMPGDLIYTCTPDGAGPLQPDDRIEVSVEGVTGLSVEVTADPRHH